MSTEKEDLRGDEEMQEYGARSIFAAGWFRAVLVLTVLAIALVVSLPYLLDWFEPVSAPSKQLARPSQNIDSSATAPPQDSVEPPEEKVRHTQPVPGIPRAASPAPAKALPPSQAAKASAGSPRSERLGAAKTAEVKGAAPGGYWVQLGLFKDARNADELTRKLRHQGFPIQVMRVTRNDSDAALGGVPGGVYHLVRAGGFGDRSAAIAARGSLSAKGYSGFVSEGVPK